MTYQEPLNQLLTLGDDFEFEKIDYKGLGISVADADELIRMATDHDLLTGDEPAFSATIHAMYALNQLQIVEAIPKLLDLVNNMDDLRMFGIWDAFPDIFRAMENMAVPTLKQYISNRSNPETSRIHACYWLGKVDRIYRDECVEFLTEFLREFSEESESKVAGMAVSVMIDLHALEHIDVIRDAFSRGVVSQEISGDFEDVEIEFGIRKKRDTPRPHYGMKYLQTEQSDAIRNVPKQEPKVGRNDPCPCGSGKKFKKCCLH